MSPLTAKFAERANKGRVEEVFNEAVPLVSRNSLSQNGELPPSTFKVLLPPGQQLQGYRYMFDKLTEKGDLIDDRIDEMAAVIEAHIRSEKIEEKNKKRTESKQTTDNHDDDDDDIVLQNPGMPHQEKFYTAGRICCDSPAEGARLNDESILLETSRSLGNGCRVKLNLSEVVTKGDGFALFPGQIVGIEGTNPSGRLLKVSRIINPPPLPPAVTGLSRLVEMYTVDDEIKAEPLNILVASGPYTMDDNFDYEVLEELVKVVAKEAPDVVILMGPFVYEGSSLVQRGTVPHTIEDTFAFEIVSRINRMLDVREGLKIILVPATAGMESGWVGFPQPPIACGLDAEEARENKAMYGLDAVGLGSATRAARVLLVPNPVQLMINEVVITLSTADSLLHVGAEECSKLPKLPGAPKPAPGTISANDRMSRLFRHLLNQRHLYPLSPPSASDYFAFDATRAYSGAVTLQATPDILVIASGQRPIVRNVDGCLCLNPGQLVKGKGTGTFARLCIHPLEVEAIKEKYVQDREMKAASMEVDEVDAVEGSKEDEDEEGMENHVVERCRVEIQRI
jgi:DNA polymerase alpha subunit B